MSFEELIEVVSESNLASIKNTLGEIIRIVNDPKSSARKLTQLIEKDPPLSARILKVANSPYYASPREISDIKYAIVRIGYYEVKSLALSQKVFEMFRSEVELPGFSLVELWKHSIAVAILAKTIYRNEFRETGENVYAAGLMHDVGLIVMSQFLTEKFAEALQRVQETHGNMIRAENEVIGFNHEDVAQRLLSGWDYPDDLTAAVGFHHRPGNADPQFFRLTSTLFVADSLCQEQEIGFCDTPNANKYLLEKHLTQLNLSRRTADMMLDQVKREIGKMESEGWF